MTKSTANFISSLGHPFLLLPLVLAWLTILKVGLESAWPTLAAIFVCIVVMVIFLYFKKKKGEISNWDVSVRAERSSNIYQPILLLTVVAAVALFFLEQPFIGDTLFFGMLMLTCYGINVKIKVSQHTVMAYYVSFLVMPVNLWVGLALLAFAPFVGWSRVVLGRHKKVEVLVGTVVGVLFGALHWILFNYRS
jgi:membrane-associated phospholipid phosphatase